MEKDAVIILDPVNMPVIKDALAKGGKNWVGGYGEGSPLPLATAHQMAERFVYGQSVPEELGGFDDNKPLVGATKEVVND
jgi:hypothetical protein